jgi:hypothetical protein
VPIHNHNPQKGPANTLLPMRPSTVVTAGYRTVGGLLILVAIAYQVHAGLEHPRFRVANYFSYFTVLSNLFAAVILLVGAARRDRPRSRAFEFLRGAAVLYMLTTGIVYAVLLSNQQVSTPWVNTVVHRVMPVVLVLDWLLDPPRIALAPKRAVSWLSFPFVYLLYTLARGPIVHWYPYPFLDPRRSGGYLRVAVSCLAIALGIIAMTRVIVWAGNARQAHIARRGVKNASLPVT